MSLQERFKTIESRIEAACRLSGRDRQDVQLLTVTKGVGVERVREAYDLGYRTFGESRLQEAVSKIRALPTDIEWHFIGRLQSNKAREVANLFSVVHTLEKQSQMVQIVKSESRIDALVQVNLAREATKGGVFPEDLDKTIELVGECSNVRFRGLMTIGPQNPDPEGNRNLFRQMAELGRQVGAQWLSMGMSADLEAAIQEGSTHVRVGTAIFGERD